MSELTKYWIPEDIIQVWPPPPGQQGHDMYMAADVEAVVKEAREVLRDLYDAQNGAPLYKYEAEWNATMVRANALLARLEETP